MQWRCTVRLTRSLALALGLLLAGLSAGRAAAERPLTLHDAIRMALRRNENLVIARESVTAASAGLSGARGAYDPLLELSGGWSRSTEPINSAFSGAPAGRLAPEIEATDAGGSIRPLLPTGGTAALRPYAPQQTHARLC